MTESRPRITVSQRTLGEVRGFAEKYSIPRDLVYGYAVDQLAQQIRESDEEQLANQIQDYEVTNNE